MELIKIPTHVKTISITPEFEDIVAEWESSHKKYTQSKRICQLIREDVIQSRKKKEAEKQSAQAVEIVSAESDVEDNELA